MRVLVYIGFMVSFLFSCSKPTFISDFTRVRQTLELNEWILQDESGASKGENNREINLKFNQDNGLNINGFAGCNFYSGFASLTNTNVVFSSIASTEKLCSASYSEETFLALLTQVDTYKISERELTFYKGKIVLLRFKAK